MSVSEKTVAGLKATFLSRAVNMGVNGLLIFLLSSVFLGPDGYGLLFLLISIVSVLQLFADLGLARSAARYIAEFKESDSGQVPHILLIAFRYRLLLLGGSVLAIVLLRTQVASAFHETELESLLLIATGLLVFRSLHTFNVVVFQGFNSVDYSAIVNIINNLGRLAFVVLFSALGFGVIGALFGYIIGAALATVVGFIFLYVGFYCSFEGDESPEKGLKRRILEYSVPLTVSRSAGVLAARIDTILIGVFMTPIAVGFYTLGRQISEFVLSPAESLGFAVSPTFGEDKANNEIGKAARRYETSVQYIILLYIPATTGLFLVSEPTILLVFGSEYAGAVPIVQIFAFYILVQSITAITTDVLDYLGRARARAFVKGICSVGNFGLNIIFIPIYGVAGAATATVITSTIYAVANLYIVYSELSIRVGQILRIAAGTTAISAVMGLCVLMLESYINSLVSLASVLLLGIIIWAGLVTVSGLIDIREALSVMT